MRNEMMRILSAAILAFLIFIPSVAMSQETPSLENSQGNSDQIIVLVINAHEERILELEEELETLHNDYSSLSASHANRLNSHANRLNSLERYATRGRAVSRNNKSVDLEALNTSMILSFGLMGFNGLIGGASNKSLPMALGFVAAGIIPSSIIGLGWGLDSTPLKIAGIVLGLGTMITPWVIYSQKPTNY